MARRTKTQLLEENARLRRENPGKWVNVSTMDDIIFQRLYGPEEYEDTGMGLALGRRIGDRHDGRIGLQFIPAQRGEP